MIIVIIVTMIYMSHFLEKDQSSMTPQPHSLILKILSISSKDSLSLGRRSSVSSGEEREEAPTTILKKISKSYEHLDRWGKVRTSDH